MLMLVKANRTKTPTTWLYGSAAIGRAIDKWTMLIHTALMSRTSRKFVAILMLLWLPLFSVSALAATVSMQLQHGGCHESAAPQTMAHEEMGDHHHHHGEIPAAGDEHSPSCSACGVCHLVCTGYLAMPNVELVALQTAARETVPYLLVFQSVTSIPLVPPPLAHA